MVRAFVLVNSETGFEKENLETIKSQSNVKEAFRVYDAYDLIVLVEEQDETQLKEAIFHRIRKLKRIKATLTLPFG